MFWFSLQPLSETFLIPRRNDKNLYLSSCKVTVIFVRFYWNLSFLDRFSKKPRIPNFMKIRTVGAEFVHADGRKNRRTDMTKLIVAFCNAASAPQNNKLSFNYRNVKDCNSRREQILYFEFGQSWYVVKHFKM